MANERAESAHRNVFMNKNVIKAAVFFLHKKILKFLNSDGRKIFHAVERSLKNFVNIICNHIFYNGREPQRN